MLGIGAVFLQYGLQFLVLRAINAIFNHSANALRIATSPPTVRRSGPNSGNVLGYGGPPSAQFAAAAGHAEEEKTGNPFFGHHSPGSGFPSFAQTQSAGAFGAEPTPFGPTYSTFHETGNYFGGSASPPRFPSLVTSPRDRFDANGDGLLQPLTDVPLSGLETSKSTPRF
ncbi:hypothetical protein AAVH_23955 [Aphelenchoides avenae]|nr:hypothetical protein AAVH_23955 [Aphelenchus avenae]